MGRPWTPNPYFISAGAIYIYTSNDIEVAAYEKNVLGFGSPRFGVVLMEWAERERGWGGERGV